MKLTVLVDNNTLIDQYYFGEPAVSYWIEADDKRILFDTGFSDVFIKNAEKLNIDLRKTDYLVFSHGHLDHTWGLEPYIDLVGDKSKNIKLIAHPDIFERKFLEGLGEIGTRKTKSEVARYFNLNLSRKPVWLTQNLCFLGEIPRENNFEAKNPLGIILKNKDKSPDYLVDDSALVYKSKRGIVIITGCSHSGICNITEYAKKIFRQSNILDIVGGFHLLNAPKEVLDETMEYFKSCKIMSFHPCHCTDLKAKIELGKHFLIQEVGSGLVLEYK